MPSYKTHSIHGELIYSDLLKYIDIDKEELKTFCIGLDSLIPTDYNTFDYFHNNNTRDYFLELLKLIKDNKQLDNKELIAFLYGQLDHFVLDTVMHPLIYYMTENLFNDSILSSHAILEMGIDKYVMKKYENKDILYYHKLTIDNESTAKVIDELYQKFHVLKAPFKYSLGIILMTYFDTFVRRDIGLFSSVIPKMINLGDIVYSENIDKVIPYLNLEHGLWIHPETGKEFTESFDDLWEKSLDLSRELLEDVNNYLYNDKDIKNPLIVDNISYDTGMPCSEGKTLKYVKKY